MILGEVKSRLYEADVRRFSAKASRVATALDLRAVVPVLFGFVVHPSARQTASALGMLVVASRPG